MDHNEPGGDKFTQRVVINHFDYDRPVVVMLEGYGLHSRKRSELARLLDANQVTIEHRFFAESTPQPPAWEHLTIWQAATDHHKIINTLKKLYPGKWITTGLSKGGQAVMFHKRFYPDDADASLAYVAPLLFSPEDKRVHDFLDQVGSDECRTKIRRFQNHLLKNRKSFRPYLSDTSSITFDFALADTMKADFDPSAMQDIRNWLHKKGNNMIYLYGEQDPWTAAAFEPSEKTNAIKLVNPEGNHKLRINRLPWDGQHLHHTGRLAR